MVTLDRAPLLNIISIVVTEGSFTERSYGIHPVFNVTYSVKIVLYPISKAFLQIEQHMHIHAYQASMCMCCSKDSNCFRHYQAVAAITELFIAIT